MLIFEVLESRVMLNVALHFPVTRNEELAYEANKADYDASLELRVNPPLTRISCLSAPKVAPMPTVQGTGIRLNGITVAGLPSMQRAALLRCFMDCAKISDQVPRPLIAAFPGRIGID